MAHNVNLIGNVCCLQVGDDGNANALISSSSAHNFRMNLRDQTITSLRKGQAPTD